MYQKEEVERLAGEYVETGSEQVFETLIKALIPLINVQLGKNYSSLKEFWDDLRQEVLLKIWKNRGGLSDTKSIRYFQYFYSRIRAILWRASRQLQGKGEDEKIKMGYDGLNPNVTYFDDLSPDDLKRLGFEVPPKKLSYRRYQRRVVGSRKRKSLNRPNRGLH